MNKQLVVILLAMPIMGGCGLGDKQQTDAQTIHSRIITLETHNDFAWTFMPECNDLTDQVSIDLMQKGRLDAAFFGSYIAQGECTEQGHKWAKERAEDMIGHIKAYIAQNADRAELALQTGDIYRMANTSKHAILLSIENGYCLGTELSNLQYFYDLGVRMITLTHNGANAISDTITDEGTTGGLTEFGRSVVEEMNRLGIVIDVSHLSRAGTLQTVELSKTPIVASHSCAFALCNHRRNLTDNEIRAIASAGGVINVALVTYFLSSEKEDDEVGLDDVIAHINYIVNLVGIDHVGIGSDFDGGGGLKGCMNMGQLGAITDALVKAGYNEEQIGKIWSGNFLRVMSQVEQYAASQSTKEN